jgi:hypothetical protein
MAYSDLLDGEIKNQLREYVSDRTIDRWKEAGVKESRPINRRAAEQLVQICGLPRAFLYADFDRLEEITPSDGRQPITQRATDRAAAGRASQAAERRVAPPDAERRRGAPDRRTGS